MANRSSLRVSRDRVERIWRREGPQVPRKQRPPPAGLYVIDAAGLSSPNYALNYVPIN